ncbi:MAG: hypothetical protein KDK39_09250 [Leptospiraceae bacterium]|nr:hypothetical protein [Leptospiraceae bacterium]
MITELILLILLLGGLFAVWQLKQRSHKLWSLAALLLGGALTVFLGQVLERDNEQADRIAEPEATTAVDQAIAAQNEAIAAVRSKKLLNDARTLQPLVESLATLPHDQYQTLCANLERGLAAKLQSIRSDLESLPANTALHNEMRALLDCLDCKDPDRSDCREFLQAVD